MRIWLSVSGLLLLLLLGLATYLGYRTYTAPRLQLPIQAFPSPPLALTSLIHFQEAVSIARISFGDTCCHHTLNQ